MGAAEMQAIFPSGINQVFLILILFVVTDGLFHIWIL